jgi:hypothetical protein
MPSARVDYKRAAAAGALGAALWAAQQPLDMRVFGYRYDDVEMLGKLITLGPSSRAIGWCLHMAAGASFGIMYARYVRPRSPFGGVTSGVIAAVTETVVLWPAAPLHDRWHPARPELPALAGEPRAFAQAIWRHVLYGAVLGGIVGPRDRKATGYVRLTLGIHPPWAMPAQGPSGSARLRSGT